MNTNTGWFRLSLFNLIICICVIVKNIFNFIRIIYNKMTYCHDLVTNGMILRYLSTILSFYALAVQYKYVDKYIYLILSILLTALDEVDNVFTIFHKYNGRYNGCTHLYYYQITDKICDSISYLLLYLFFKLDNVLLAFILYRIIGVVLFYFTKDSDWLILFFDFAKEYLLYLFFFSTNYSYIIPFILCKIVFESYFHTVHLKNNYK